VGAVTYEPLLAIVINFFEIMIKKEDFIDDGIAKALEEIIIKLKEIVELKKIAFGEGKLEI
jgi:hypothetical protein